MKEIENLPTTFQIKYEESMPCGCLAKETITYHLKIDVLDHDTNHVMKRYFRLFYTPIYYKDFKKSPRVIGNDLGLGSSNLALLAKELEAELLKVKKL